MVAGMAAAIAFGGRAIEFLKTFEPLFSVLGTILQFFFTKDDPTVQPQQPRQPYQRQTAGRSVGKTSAIQRFIRNVVKWIAIIVVVLFLLSHMTTFLLNWHRGASKYDKERSKHDRRLSDCNNRLDDDTWGDACIESQKFMDDADLTAYVLTYMSNNWYSCGLFGCSTLISGISPVAWSVFITLTSWVVYGVVLLYLTMALWNWITSIKAPVLPQEAVAEGVAASAAAESANQSVPH